MSFWPKLRRRSRGRKRSTAKPNPYANIGLDKLAIVHAEFDAQRALFAAEKGVPVSIVRFVSGSPRGWTLLPKSAVSPSPQEEEEEEEEEDNPSSSTSTPPASPTTGSVPAQAQVQEVLSPRPRFQRTSSSRNFASEAQPTRSTPIPDLRFSEKADSSSSSSSAITATLNVGSISNFTELKKSKSSEIEGHSGGIGGGVSDKDLAWNNKLTHTASVLLVSIGVFTTVLGPYNLSAFFLSSWNLGKSSFKRVFSILATHLISYIRPSLQLKLSSSSSENSILSSQSSELEAEMKVTSLTPISASVPSKEIDPDSRSSSFAFPVLSRDSSVGSPIFRVQQDLSTSQGQHQHGQAIVAAATALRPVVTSVKVVAVSSQPGSPAFEGIKGCQKPCQKLKARIFKCHPPRKVTPATSENSSAEEDVTDSGADVEASNRTQTQGETDSPRETDSRSTDSPRRRRLSFIKRRSKNSKGGTTESDDQLSELSGTFGKESELDEVSSPLKSTRVVTVKASKSSSDVLTSRNPNSGDSATLVKKLSRSQELKLSFKNLKKKYKSQELCPVASNEQECRQLEIESATTAVTGLEELAFPFNHETDSSNCSTPTTPERKLEKRKSCLIRMRSGDCDKLAEGNVSSSPRSNSTTTTTSRLSRSLASKMSTEKNTIMDCKPELRKVRPVLTRLPIPIEHGVGDLGRTSSFMDRETLGALLVLAVLVLLLLGKIPAILGTAGVCLILSHVRKYLSYNMTPRERERLGSKSASGGDVVGRGRVGGTSPPHSNNSGQTNPAVDVQSSEYRKKVLIEGFLDRGNRRTG